MKFKQWLEATEEDIEIAMKVGPHDNLGKLFKDKLRVVFPLKYNNNNTLKKKVAKQDKYHFDFDNHKAWKIVVDGLGHKRKQEIKITRALNALNPDLLDLYLASSNLSIILSKHPVDLLRMSDFKNMQSCHSKGGSHYQCVFDEINSGGAIAYLVRTSDLANVNLDSQEIFSNPDTNKGTIRPLARIRARLYTAPNGKQKIVSSKTYGLERGSKLEEEFSRAVAGYFGSWYDMNKDNIQGGTYVDPFPWDKRKEGSKKLKKKPDNSNWEELKSISLKKDYNLILTINKYKNPFLAPFIYYLSAYHYVDKIFPHISGQILFSYFEKARPEIIKKVFSSKYKSVKTSNKNNPFELDEPPVSFVSENNVIDILKDYAQYYLMHKLINYSLIKMDDDNISYRNYNFVKTISERRFLDYLSYWLLREIKQESKNVPKNYIIGQT